jgi:cytochrome c biogenesis protein CcmG, thiol:disulfide interchange protein DsbE
MMNRFVLPLVGFFVLAGVLYIGVKRSPDREHLESVLLGKPAPQFVLPDLMNPGATLSNAKFTGKPYLINFWGTWCVTCRYEHPMLMQLASKQGVPIVGINWKDEDESLSHEWLQKFGNPYTAIAQDKTGHEAINWGVTAAPETFLVDGNGIVRYRLASAMTQEIWDHEFVPRLQSNQTVAR